MSGQLPRQSFHLRGKRGGCDPLWGRRLPRFPPSVLQVRASGASLHDAVANCTLPHHGATGFNRSGISRLLARLDVRRSGLLPSPPERPVVGQSALVLRMKTGRHDVLPDR